MDYFLSIPNIDLESTFNCGQCFRWRKSEDGVYTGFAGNRRVKVRQGEGGVLLLNIPESDVPYWEHYFAADTDYSALIARFSADPTLRSACDFAPGIRVLRQERFETLISFIISQNNNIARIAGIIDKLCGDGGFPSAKTLAALSESDLSSLKAGYRTKYILDAAKKVNSGEISLDKVAEMGYNEAKGELLKIVGVGDKVADCVLLFGFAKWEAFPRDVWVKRMMGEFYPDGLPECTKGFEGIAQQFLFHYRRLCRGD
jgi:N-glycosylase/DNA lyase